MFLICITEVLLNEAFDKLSQFVKLFMPAVTGSGNTEELARLIKCGCLTQLIYKLFC